jgi:nucleosome binding factor SPN SPT16 subunit
MVSLGARYKQYCSNISRTFLIDAPKYVSQTYEALLGMQTACMDAMQPGRPIKFVYQAALQYLDDTNNTHAYKKHMPKNLGFSIGLDFRDSHLLLSQKNPATIRAGMVFNLSLGFANVPLSDEAKKTVSDKSAVRTVQYTIHLRQHELSHPLISPCHYLSLLLPWPFF